MTLPEAVEQAIIEHGLAAEAYFEAFLHLPTKVNRRFAEKVESADALRSAILAYGAARERQGIERAAEKVCKYCAAKQPVVFSNKLDQWIHEPLERGPFNAEGYVWDYCKAAAARALPVDGATP